MTLCHLTKLSGKLKGLKLHVIAASLLLSSLAQASPFAYVPNEKSGTISIIDCAVDKVIAVMPAGTKPRGLAVSPDGKTLYVSDQPANALLIIDLASRMVVGFNCAG